MIYNLKIIFTNRETLDEWVDEEKNKRLNGTLRVYKR